MDCTRASAPRLLATHVTGLTRLVGHGRLPWRRRTIAGTGFDLHLIRVQQVRNRLFPARHVFVTDGLIDGIVFGIVVADGFVDSTANQQRFFFELARPMLR